jgi:radical SAM superfamily enzyme YgiQ (UPF0313 family)
MADKNDTFLRELIKHHVSGQLKVAPEHISHKVLKYMGKPAGKTYGNFTDKFYRITEKMEKKQYIIPYLMSSHPGSTLKEAIELAEYLRDIHYQPEQVQDFYPTPGTLSTTMFYTGLDPLTMKEVYIPKTKSEKAMQRALLQYRDPKKYDLVYAALVQAGREDLIGYGPKCLIRPREKRNRDEYGTVKGKPKNNFKGNLKGRTSKEKSSVNKGNRKDKTIGKQRDNNSGNRRDVKIKEKVR